jgi:YYY domain-containing protein
VALGVSGAQSRSEEPPIRALRAATLAIVLVTVLLANPWNLPLCVVFLAILRLGALPPGRITARDLASAILAVALPASCAVLLALPFTRRFAPPFHGVGRVHTPTPITNLLVMFGFLLLPALVFTVRRLASRGWWTGTRAPIALVAIGLLLLAGWAQGATFFATAVIALTAIATLAGPWRGTERAIPLAFIATAAIAIALGELVYVREPYPPEFYRQNTIFKLYVQAWVFLAVILPAFARRRTASTGSVPTIGPPLLALGVAASLCYPVAALAGRMSSEGLHPELDGTRYLERDHPDDAAAIAWLRDTVTGRPVVLEAAGEPYAYYARVSSTTGLPTVLGWINHERVWRADQPFFSQRVDDIRTMYGSNDLAAVTELLRRYRVRYVFLGELERREVSPAGFEKFTRHPETFTPVFTSGDTMVFRVASE